MSRKERKSTIANIEETKEVETTPKEEKKTSKYNKRRYTTNDTKKKDDDLVTAPPILLKKEKEESKNNVLSSKTETNANTSNRNSTYSNNTNQGQTNVNTNAHNLADLRSELASRNLSNEISQQKVNANSKNNEFQVNFDDFRHLTSAMKSLSSNSNANNPKVVFFWQQIHWKIFFD